MDVEAVVNQAAQSGFPPNVSDAHTINGHPGPVPGCSSQGTEMGISSQFIFVFTKKHMKKKNSILMQTCPQSTQFSHAFLKIIYQFNRLNLKNLIIPTQFEGIINFFSNLDFSRPPISVLNLNVKRTKAKYIISI